MKDICVDSCFISKMRKAQTFWDPKAEALEGVNKTPNAFSDFTERTKWPSDLKWILLANSNKKVVFLVACSSVRSLGTILNHCILALFSDAQ